MFKVSQDFTFTVSQNDLLYDFTGQLVFANELLNSTGTLHTEDELTSFGALLNDSLEIPDIWTLELLAQHLFIHARPVFNNLTSINLWMTNQPQRVAEYSSSEEYTNIDGSILELEEIS